MKFIINNDVKSIGEILTENWEIKKKLSDSISSTGLDKEMNEIRKINGVYGGENLAATNGLLQKERKVSKYGSRERSKFRALWIVRIKRHG